MYDIILDLEQWYAQNETIGISTVIHTWGSSPRGLGAKMAFTSGGKLSGSVSGGCIEGAVVEAGLEVLQTGRPKRLDFGVSDKRAMEVGLSCGGNIEVFVQSLDKSFYDAMREEIRQHHIFAAVTIVSGLEEQIGRIALFREDGKIFGDLGMELETVCWDLIQLAFQDEMPHRKRIITSIGQETDVFIDILLPPPTLVIIGGVHISIALARLAKVLGYEVVVIDPRRAFGNEERFPHIDRLIQLWPEEAFQHVNLTKRTIIVMLTHDPKIDDPALKIALKSDAFYVGALGSLKTQARRRERLLAGGISEEQLARLYGPVGLNLGAKTPEEIALSILAEVVCIHRGQNLVLDTP